MNSIGNSAGVTCHLLDGEIAHFVDYVLNERESCVNLDDAAKTHAVCYALNRSATQVRRVKLEEIHSEVRAE